MSLVIMGASYKTAPIELRERIAVAASELDGVLHALVEDESVRESVVLSTCNRVELVVDAKTDHLGAAACAAVLEQRAGELFDPQAFYLHRGPEAVRHLLRVVSSLDSQVLGEAQILGQAKRAFADAVEAGTCGEVLSELFKAAIRLGKRVRTETGIGSDSVSLSTTAFKAACSQVDDIASCGVVLLGAGEMARCTAAYLRDAHVRDLTVATRTFAHAQEFAAEFGMRALPFEQRYAALAQADVVFSMTGAQEAVVEASALAAAREDAGTTGRTLVVVDESVPRDVEFSCRQLPGVVLFDQEMLADIVDEGLHARLRAVADVGRMVEQAEEEFLAWMQERLVVPTIKEIYEKGDIVVADELARARKELEKLRGGSLRADEVEVLAAYGNAVMKKLVHGPVMRLRKEAGNPDSYYYTGAARYLFGLDVFPPGTRRPCKERGCSMGRPCPIGLDERLQPFCRTAGEE